MSTPTSANCLVLTDIHGAWNTLVRLLNTVPKGTQIVFGGDMIDRGPHSRKVVEFAMDNGIPTVQGNHENLALAFYKRDTHDCAVMYDPGVWLDNGGNKALLNWPTVDMRCATPAEHQRAQRDRYLGGRVPNTVLDWMEGLPAYLYPSNVLDENGRRLFLSHTGYGLRADEGNWFAALWGRRHEDGPFVLDAEGNEVDDGLFRAIGHSPVKAPIMTDTYCNIDTGCVYGNRGGGTLTALLWPSKTLFTQIYDETPVARTFEVEHGGLLV